MASAESSSGNLRGPQSKTPFHGKPFRVERTTGSVKDTKREIYWFAKKGDAEEDARDRNVQLAAHGSELQLSSLERADAINALAILRPLKMSLTEAAKCCKSFESVRHSSKPLSDFVREYEAKMEARVASGGRRAGGYHQAPGRDKRLKDRGGVDLHPAWQESAHHCPFPRRRPSRENRGLSRRREGMTGEIAARPLLLANRVREPSHA